MDTRELIRAKIAETLDRPPEKVVDDVELLDLVQSSFLLVELVIELQEEFNVQFVQEDLKGVQTAGHLIDLVANRMSGDG
jgi:acyl carrier protein